MKSELIKYFIQIVINRRVGLDSIRIFLFKWKLYARGLGYFGNYRGENISIENALAFVLSNNKKSIDFL